ncbi:hypothetical protein GCM10011351_22240 [Paraliobacillus quinghaiensis]|uniref:Uncharacterized protein n=1 Tax=Paraliobacillus quinghaiensis TaxID=470815 RepID=A0A917TS60_9BACI|nr:hypothetical protein GCM10011351_22240 [Paraliobacillus quinghaiensis]
MKLSTLLQEQRELKIHSEVVFASELAEAVPAEREAISFEERVSIYCGFYIKSEYLQATMFTKRAFSK